MQETQHLSRPDIVNFGSFYTPEKLIRYLNALILKNIPKNILKDSVLLDSSCGTGNLFTVNIPTKRKIGVDIDTMAIDLARERFSVVEFHNFNTLVDISRDKYFIKENDKLIIIGNPPYNDRTSIIGSHIKKHNLYNISSRIVRNDIGISFLLSYNELKADYVCILHPLSYLIKKTNFNRLKDWTSNYILQDGIVVSSQEFCPTSANFFPIIIAIYKRQDKGMDYEYIKNYSFLTDTNKSFQLNNFDFINNYIDKYPNGKKVDKDKAIALFYTLRDINALKRSRTFIDRQCPNAVYVMEDKYSLYCYIDVFKKFIDKIPYYLGNCDIFIDYQEFKKYEDDFITCSKTNTISDNIKKYFEKVFKNFI